MTHETATTVTRSPSLLDQIGGQPAVDAAVDGLYARILADTDLAPYFAGRSTERIKAHQRGLIAAALGGAVRYDGRTMHDAHRHLHVTRRAFAAVVAHLGETLDALGVAPDLIAAIGAALTTLESDVVTRGAP